MGATNYVSLDINGQDGAEVFDLNYDRVAPERVGQFDLVTNFGTS